jgi:hypothetical protein
MSGTLIKQNTTTIAMNFAEVTLPGSAGPENRAKDGA